MRTDRLAAVQCNERADDCEEDDFERQEIQFSPVETSSGRDAQKLEGGVHKH